MNQVIEEASQIPVRNIYYLLVYAWDLFREGEDISVDREKCPDINNLLAHLLADGIRRLSTRGVDKGYLPIVETTSRLRGRIRVSESARKLTHASGRMVCEFDELSMDTLPNQILKATCQRLLNARAQLTPSNRQQIRESRNLLSPVSNVPINNRSFYKLQLHRNNRHYRLLIHICELLHQLYLPTKDMGNRRFKSLLDDDKHMARIFEKFTFVFAKRNFPEVRVSAMEIPWVVSGFDGTDELLPKMKTDVTLDRPDRKTILDCKFYRKALRTSQFGKRQLRSGHLYQLSSYLQNKSRHAGWEKVEGILLYPTVNDPVNATFELLDHKVAIRSVDLDQPWEHVHEQMLQILH